MVSNLNAEIYLNTASEGGRITPIFDKFSVQIVVGDTVASGKIFLPAGTIFACPGDRLNVTISLTNPIDVTEGFNFQIKEGLKNIGTGTVLKILTSTSNEGQNAFINRTAVNSTSAVNKKFTYCIYCGAANDTSAKRCTGCGAALRQ